MPENDLVMLENSLQERYASFDRFGAAPPSFDIKDIDSGLVEMVLISTGGGVVGQYPFLTDLGRKLYERHHGGPPPGGWAPYPDLVKP